MTKNYTEEALIKAQEYYESSMSITTFDNPQPDELGYIRIKYSELREKLKQYHKLGWSNGACYMLACVNTDARNQK